MKCDRCKKSEAMIHVEGVGDFCLDCYNDIISRAFGTEKFNNFSKHISVYDVDGEIHRFEVWNMLLPEYSIWHADEIDGGYQFEVMTGLNDDQSEALYHLHQKILIGIGYKSLIRYSDEETIKNTYLNGKAQFSLNQTGTGRIEITEDQKPGIVIDGHLINFEDFGKMATAYAGFNMVFQFCDQSDEILEKDTVLKKLSINPNIILSRFEKTLEWFIEDDFLSIELQEACEEALEERIDELELLYNYGDRDTAIDTGRKIKNRLKEIETDSDDFPSWLIEDINRVLEIEH